MDPATLIPVPDALPVHWGWFYVLLLVTFFLHIILMNIMLGSVFIATATHLFQRSQYVPDCTTTAHTLPFTIALAVNFGVAPLLFVQVLFGHLVYSSSILMGVYWLWIIGLLIGAYYLAYLYKYNYSKLVDGRVLLTGSITLLLLTIGFFFTNNFTLMLSPERWPEYFQHPGGMMLNTEDPTLVPRYLHFMTSAIAVGGLSTALLSSYKTRQGDTSAQEGVTKGCQWFGYATMVNFGFGAWFLGALNWERFAALPGTKSFFFIFLVIGIFSGSISAILALREKIVPATIAGLLAVFFMILVRDQLRSAYLAPWFSPADLSVQPQYSPLILFLLVFGGGLCLVWWMLKLAWTAKNNEEVQS